MYPHRIRLRGPWEYQPLLVRPTDCVGPPMTGEIHAEKGKTLRVNMPCRWDQPPLSDCSGPIHFRRRFGFPGRIDDFERVWLILDALSRPADVWLNENHLGRLDGTGQASDSIAEFEITRLLRHRNELLIAIGSPGTDGLPWAEAALEVRCTAYLKAMRAWLTTAAGAWRLHVSGKVVGSCDGPLEIYVLLDQATVGYLSVAANEAGQPFYHGADVGSSQLPPGEVRVELVNGASVWYDWRISEPAIIKPQERT